MSEKEELGSNMPSLDKEKQTINLEDRPKIIEEQQDMLKSSLTPSSNYDTVAAPAFTEPTSPAPLSTQANDPALSSNKTNDYALSYNPVAGAAPSSTQATDPAPLSHEATDPAPLSHEATDPAPLSHEATDPAPLSHEATDAAPPPTQAIDKRVEIVDLDGTVHLEKAETVAKSASPNIEGAVCLMNPKNKELGRRRVELKAALKVGLLFLSFLLLWTPLPLLVTVMTVTWGVPKDVDQANLLGVVSALATTTAALDPILYGLLNRQIYIAMKQMLKNARRRIGGG
ncbi:hypothetical protein EGW08_014012 [Elysia chlorotica]|uniref:G-protein coupled receptors family 1 profile domain-containing protein n=1 Tax=Elysia chlorotica TaxID=188477 RepID=A0A3S1B2F1_ELYCH|nr:hypothetical protein EGW08_014012 [Elysia chlorotica]